MASFGFTSAALGALAAHGLKKQLNAEYLAVFRADMYYQLIHALTLFSVTLLATHLDSRLMSATGGLFTLDVLLFSGSLYLLTLGDIGKFSIVIPLGGTSSLADWLCLELATWRLGNV